MAGSDNGDLLANPSRLSRGGISTGLAIRVVAVVALILAPFLRSGPLLWFAAFILAFQWLASFITRLCCRTHFDELYELRRDSLDGEDPAAEFPGVTVISPARNEEDAIEEAARSLAALDYPNLEVIIVNDHSTDATRAILERVQRDCPHVRVFHDPPLQEGWLGKANAVWFAVHQAHPENRWLLLTDGDVVFDPKTVRRAVAHAEAAQWDFLTCVPYLDNRTFAEELILPNAWRDIMVSSSLRALNKPDGRPIGIGAFILVKRNAYLESGGHAAICAQQPEDTLLGDIVRKWGGRIGVAWTSEMLRVRLYRGYKQLRSFMVRKTRVSADDSVIGLGSRVAYTLIQFVLPLPLGIGAAAMQLWRHEFSWPLTCYAILALGDYIDVARGMRQARPIVRMRRGLPWLHPVCGLVRAWLLLIAIAQILAKKKMEWRGRDFTNARAQNTAEAPLS